VSAAAAVGTSSPAPVSGPRAGSRPPPRLVAEHVSKRFGTFAALDDVTFTLEPGSFHALLGENGAGKSTLVKCIMGFYQADSGRVLVGDQAIAVKSPREAQLHGIGMVYQHFTLVENMTVAENLVLSRARIPAVIDWHSEEKSISGFMQTMPFRIEPRRAVRDLAAGEKQKLEILKQLYLGSRIVILDEPTSVLTPGEADEILGMLRRMAHDGRISVVLITHRFREVIEFADEVTVLRRGRLAGTGRTAELTPTAMAAMMVGSDPPETSLERSDLRAERSVLELTELTAEDDLGLPVLRGVTLSVSAGEILGIAGVSGNGQDQLVEVIAGQRRKTGGSLRVAGVEYRATRREMREQRVRLLPEAPLRNACVATLSVAENLSFRSFDASPFAALGWLLRRGRVRHAARSAIREYRVKTSSPDAPLGSLSGGNVQRVVLARELSGDVAILVAANPCFGLDFAAVSEIRTRLLAARNRGAAVLLVSADLEEIFALSDRIVVMSEGRIVYETRPGRVDLGEIGRHMAGHR
jgi:simple sugar transport system ATP-binding protein